MRWFRTRAYLRREVAYYVKLSATKVQWADNVKVENATLRKVLDARADRIGAMEVNSSALAAENIKLRAELETMRGELIGAANDEMDRQGEACPQQ